MKTNIDSEVVSNCAPKERGCGCGGHGGETSAAESLHDECGCHSSSTSPAPVKHSCAGGCRGIRTSRRIHATLGLVLTAFLFLHLGVASLGLAPAHYDAAASMLRRLSEQIPLLETILLLLIATQTGVGIRLLVRSGLGYQSRRCKEDGQMRYFLQRWSAMLLLMFIVVHLAMFKLWLGEPTFVTVARHFTLGGNRLLLLFYSLAIAGIAFHAGNGLWTGASVWGVRESHPRLWLGIAGVSGTIIAILGFLALRAFAV